MRVPLRFALVAALLGVAYVVVSASRPSQSFAALHPRAAGTTRWFSERQPQFSSYEYVPLNDAAGVTAVVQHWMSRGDLRLAAEQAAALQRDIARFLSGLSLPTPDAYLSHHRPDRQLRPDLASDPYVHARFRELTGRMMPMAMDSGKVLQRFWHGHPASPGQPVAIARDGVIDVALTRPTQSDPAALAPNDLMSATLPQLYSRESLPDFLNKWQSPSIQAFVPITRPTAPLASVIQTHRTTLGCEFRSIVRTSDDQYVIVAAYLFYNPDDRHWHVEVASHQHSMPIFWPL